MMGDYPTLAIREAAVAIVQKQMYNEIVESDSLIVTRAIRGDIKPSSQIWSLIEDIIILSKAIENIAFLYCSRLSMIWLIGSLKRRIFLIFKSYL